MKKLLLLLFILIFGVKVAFAESDSVLAQQDPQLTFPITELGKCNNVQTCKVYCDQPQNHEACIAFAKSKGLYKHKVSPQKADALILAKSELGCDTITSCKALCEQKENYQQCKSFAIKHGLAHSPPEHEQLLAKAKQHLNCDSFESCKALCDHEANYTKCAALLQDQVTSDDRAMFEKYKPQIREFLGCDSMVTCMAFCMNPLNMPRCQELGNKIGSTEQIPNQEPPEVWCPKISSECRWDGANCVCQGPQTCAQSNDIPGCTWDGTQCNCPGIEGSPEQWCPKSGPGCTWDGKLCTCPGSESSTGTTPQTTEPGDVWCPRISPYCVWDGSSCTCWDECVKAGGTWTGTRCNPPLEQTTSPDQIYATPEPGEVWCPRNPDCKWIDETCLCTAVQAPQTEPTVTPTVQGVTTEKGLLQQIVEFVLRNL